MLLGSIPRRKICSLLYTDMCIGAEAVVIYTI